MKEKTEEVITSRLESDITQTIEENKKMTTVHEMYQDFGVPSIIRSFNDNLPQMLRHKILTYAELVTHTAPLDKEDYSQGLGYFEYPADINWMRMMLAKYREHGKENRKSQKYGYNNCKMPVELTKPSVYLVSATHRNANSDEELNIATILVRPQGGMLHVFISYCNCNDEFQLDKGLELCKTKDMPALRVACTKKQCSLSFIRTLLDGMIQCKNPTFYGKVCDPTNESDIAFVEYMED